MVGLFRLSTLKAVILNKAMSLVVVTVALFFRSGAVPYHQLLNHSGVALNLLAGSLVGAWWAAGHAMRLSRQWLDRVVLVLLVGIALLLLSEQWFDLGGGAPLFESGAVQLVVALIAGFLIGTVAAFLGVAGGELLIPTIVLLYGLDVKLAGSLSLAVSLPTMIVGFTRYSHSSAFQVMTQERSLFLWMTGGSILGAAVGGLFLGVVPTDLLITLLSIILLASAVQVFRGAH